MSIAAYAGVVKQLVGRLKYSGAVAAVRPMSSAMVRHLGGSTLIVPVPTSNVRRRQRGYDQAELLAHALARSSGLAYARLLARTGERHQIGANRQQRLEQLQGAFRVRQPATAHGTAIILLDDVVTTGATLEAAAQALTAAGASQIRALAFAQA